MIDDIRKLLQDLISPEFKALQAQVKANDDASKQRDDALSAKMDRKFEMVIAKMDANHATILNALNIDKRVEAIERQTMASARTS
ncbi:MAG TPA: hypothetical protein VFC39_20125 [Acidobacteriaceae bacterium]|nr:hypothetical protein [Acidobacteriaceae bacterium]